MEERQRNLSLLEVLAGGLTQFLLRSRVVQDVVHELESDPHRLPVIEHPCAQGLARSGKHRSRFARRGDQRCGLVEDDAQVFVFGIQGCRISSAGGLPGEGDERVE
jgi:hypothetical protein